ncbi:MAG: hypothetical protein ABMA15_18065, partial [Vicinamibacterales bacterium]
MACALAASLVLASGQARADVGDYLGKPVVSITIRSEGRTLAEARLAALIETTVGRPLTMRAVRESVTHLFSLALFEDVRVLADAASSGVALTYELIPLHPVESLEFAGAVSGIETGRLRRGLVERYGSSPRAARSTEMARDVEQMLRDVGYLDAHVTVKAQIQHAPERTTLTFSLEPGARARVGTVSVEGDPGISQTQLLTRLELKTGAPYERDRLNQRIEAYLADRRKARHYEARLTVTPTV